MVHRLSPAAHPEAEHVAPPNRAVRPRLGGHTGALAERSVQAGIPGPERLSRALDQRVGIRCGELLGAQGHHGCVRCRAPATRDESGRCCAGKVMVLDIYTLEIVKILYSMLRV